MIDTSRLENAFRAATALEGAARTAFLANLAREDGALARDVHELLEADARAQASDLFADSLASEIIATAWDAPEGRRVGGYRLVSLIGQGGMGRVFLAEQPEIGKRVAVKLLQAGLASQEDVRRFLRERRVLAGLEHPNIVPLLEAGVTADRTPYFAMEYVDGVAITDHCRQHGLDLEARVRLFHTVCAAVEHAHQHLVVHRDLKPSNILVDRDGTVKLLDFGIAKLLDADDEDMTRTGVSPMTPESAAPEQMRRQAATPATDVYALGLLLYELLADKRAYSLRDLSPSQAERIVCETMPPPPSTVRPDAKDRRRIATDLDAICLKALEKDPRRRYPTAGHLAADVARYLARRPVEARVPTVLYRAGKFMRRHRLRLAIVACLLIAALGAVATVAWQARRAERALAESEAVSRFLLDLFELTDPAHGRSDGPTVRELIERGERRTAQLADQPVVYARMVDLIGRVHQRLGNHDRAAELLREALTIRRASLGDAHPQVAASLHHLAVLHSERGDLEDADRLFRDALARRQQSLGPDDVDTATTRERYAMFLLRTMNDVTRAEAVLSEGLPARRDDPRAGVARAIVLRGLAAVHNERRDMPRAAALLQEAVDLQRAGGATFAERLLTLGGLARVLAASGALASADEQYEEILTLQHQINGPRHPSAILTLAQRAAVVRRSGDLPRAEALYREAIDRGRDVLGAAHPTLARIEVGLAATLAQAGRTHDAETLYQSCLTRLAGQPHVMPSEVRDVHRRLAALYEGTGRPALARQHARLAAADVAGS